MDVCIRSLDKLCSTDFAVVADEVLCVLQQRNEAGTLIFLVVRRICISIALLSLGTQHHQTQRNNTQTHKFWISHNPETAGSSLSPQPKDCDRKDVTVFFFDVTLKNAAAILSEPPAAASGAVHARGPLQSAGRVL